MNFESHQATRNTKRLYANSCTSSVMTSQPELRLQAGWSLSTGAYTFGASGRFPGGEGRVAGDGGGVFLVAESREIVAEGRHRHSHYDVRWIKSLLSG